MNAERIVRIVAGFFILLSLSLGVEASPLFVSKYFLLFTAFVGLNLLQSGFTKFCPLDSILAKTEHKTIAGRGAAWISALAWGARGPEFKSRRPD